jgi:Flp pilus assembly protein TadB
MTIIITLGLIVGLSIGWSVYNFKQSKNKRIALHHALQQLEAGGDLHELYRDRQLERLRKKIAQTQRVKRLAPGLRLINRTPEAVVNDMISTGGALAVMGAVLGVGVTMMEHMPVAVPVVLAAIGALIGPLAALGGIDKRIKKAREHFRNALASFMQLVAIAMVSGMGSETAFQAVAEFSDDWSITMLKQRIQQSIEYNTSIPDTLLALADDIEDRELASLAAAMQRALDTGSPLADTVYQKAQALHDTALADAESKAGQRSEKLFMPASIMSLGFLVLIGYPGIANLMHGLSHGL